MSVRLFPRIFLTLIFATSICTGLSSRASEAASCSSATGSVTAVSLKRKLGLRTNFGGNKPGKLQSVLTASVVTKQPTCLIVHISAYAQPADNRMIFQAAVNGVVMEGHASGIPGHSFAAPAIGEENRTDEFLDFPRTVAYTFFKLVKSGKHNVVFNAADCCGSGLGGQIHSATLTVFH